MTSETTGCVLSGWSTARAGLWTSSGGLSPEATVVGSSRHVSGHMILNRIFRLQQATRGQTATPEGVEDETNAHGRNSSFAVGFLIGAGRFCCPGETQRPGHCGTFLG